MHVLMKLPAHSSFPTTTHDRNQRGDALLSGLLLSWSLEATLKGCLELQPPGPNLFTNHPIRTPRKSAVQTHFAVFDLAVHNTNGL